MTPLSFLSKADFVASLIIDAAVLYLSFKAYRRTRMTAFALLIWSTFMSIILEIGLHLRAPTSPQDSVFFHEWYRIGYLAQLIIWGIAVILLIRYVQKSFEEKPPPNLSPHPSAVDAPNSATRPTPAVGGGSSPGR